MKKELNKQLNKQLNKNRGFNVKLTVYDLIKKGFNSSKIADILGKSQPAIYRYTRELRAEGLIKKVAYGTWEVTEKEVKELNKTVWNGLSVKGKRSKVNDIIRGHGFVFTLKVPNMRNWDKREVFLNKREINFVRSGIANGTGLRIVLDGWKVWLFNKNIVFYAPSEYSIYKGGAESVRVLAMEGCFKLIGKLESLLKVGFKMNGTYMVKVVKQHYADMKNALAKQYKKKGKVLRLRGSDGEWLLIDWSEGIAELETVHGKTAVRDMDQVVKPFFNDLRDNNPPLPSELAVI